MAKGEEADVFHFSGPAELKMPRHCGGLLPLAKPHGARCKGATVERIGHGGEQ